MASSLANNAPARPLLSSVDCIRYLTLPNSTQTPLFERQMRELGLWRRVAVQVSAPSPRGKEAGCFDAHQRAWRESLATGCRNLLVLEEDVFFDARVVAPGAAHADDFLSRGDYAYDMLFLGWGLSFLNISTEVPAAAGNTVEDIIPAGYTYVAPIDHYRCVYRIHHWLDTTAYVISRDAMARYGALSYTPGLPIDVMLQALHDRDRFFTIRPQVRTGDGDGVLARTLSALSPAADSKDSGRATVALPPRALRGAHRALQPHPSAQIAYQRYHGPPPGQTAATTGGTGDWAEWFLSHPELVRDVSENRLVYGWQSNVTLQTCLKPHGDYYA